MHDVMRIVVIENKLCSFDYFLDVMQPWELEFILKNLAYAQKNEWEQTRLLYYGSIQPYLKSDTITELRDVLPLPFDEKEEKHKEQKTTKESFKQLKKRGDEIASLLNKGATRNVTITASNNTFHIN